MKKILLILILTIFMGKIYGQSIDAKVLSQIQSSYKKDATNTALVNIITNNSLKDVTYSRENALKEDHFFKYEVKSGRITNQNSSGRCWMYTSLNVFRPIVMSKLNISDFEFSESYLYFWDMLEKSNVFLERIIATANEDIYSREVYDLLEEPVQDGGAWNTFINLIDKYGIVPSNIMPENEQTKNTSALAGVLNNLLREYALTLRDMVTAKKTSKDIQTQKIEMLKNIYKILVYTIGEPPTEFQWRYKNKDNVISDYKTYTPISFWKEVVGADVSNYVMLMDDPTRPYYKLYSKKNDKNTYEGIDWTFVNIPTTEIKNYAIASIKAGEILYFSCDVSKQLSKENSSLDLKNYDYASLFGIDFNMTREQRMKTHQSGSSHGMALCGVDVDNNGNPTKWKLENSWGSTYGNAGFLTMTDEWFTEYFFRLVVNKKFLDSKVLDVLKQKPEEVPYYFPAFSEDK